MQKTCKVIFKTSFAVIFPYMYNNEQIFFLPVCNCLPFIISYTITLYMMIVYERFSKTASSRNSELHLISQEGLRKK